MSLRLRGILLVICQGYCFKYNVSSCRLLGMGPPPLIVSSGRNLLMHDATSLTVWRGMQQFCACCHFFHFGEARIHIFHLIQVMEVCNSFSAIHVSHNWINTFCLSPSLLGLHFHPEVLVFYSLLNCVNCQVWNVLIWFFWQPPHPTWAGTWVVLIAKDCYLYTKTHIHKLSLFLGGHLWASMLVGDVVGTTKNMKYSRLTWLVVLK